MSQDPGWYYAQGDPPGTQRYWDGAQWVGEPTPVQGAAPAAAGVPGGGMPAAVGGGQYASWGTRAAALLIDAAVLLVLYIAVFILTAIFGAISDALGAIVLILGYLAILAFGLYVVAWVQGETGQSPGKRVMGIQVVKSDTGQFIGGGLGIGRYLLSFINSLPCYLGWLWPLWDDKSQTFVDKILSTSVTTAEKKPLFPLIPGGPF